METIPGMVSSGVESVRNELKPDLRYKIYLEMSIQKTSDRLLVNILEKKEKGLESVNTLGNELDE